MIGLLLSMAIVVLWWAHVTHASPIVTVCRCGDMVQHSPGWPIKCPSCGEIIL